MTPTKKIFEIIVERIWDRLKSKKQIKISLKD